MTMRDVIELTIAALLAVLAYAHRQSFETAKEDRAHMIQSLEDMRVEMSQLRAEFNRVVDAIMRMK